MAPVTFPIVAVKSHTYTVTVHIAAATSRMNPFEPTAYHEKFEAILDDFPGVSEIG